MKNKLHQILQKHEFQPGWIGLFTNPFFITRNGLANSFKEFTDSLHGRTLDFGCGEKPYRNLFRTQEYIGIDTKSSGHAHREQSHVDIFFDGAKVPFDDGHFDSVFASEVLEHLFFPDEALREMNRVLKMGGTLLISTPFCWDEHEIPYDFARYSSYGLKNLLERNGFEVMVQKKVGSFSQTILQLICLYFYYKVANLSLKWRLVLSPLTIWPWNLLSLASKVKPTTTFYLTNVVFARKIK